MKNKEDAFKMMAQQLQTVGTENEQLKKNLAKKEQDFVKMGESLAQKAEQHAMLKIENMQVKEQLARLSLEAGPGKQ